jgi:hypothetical protein
VLKELHVVIALAGRRIDPADIGIPVFPYAAVNEVRKRLRDLFHHQDARALVSSAACGSDLIALQAAGELGMRRRIILPFEPNRFRKTSVIDRPGDWGPLFDTVVAEVMEKHDLVDLHSEQDTNEVYLHANRVILDEAISLAAASGNRVVAVRVWDEVSRGESDITRLFGDTAHALGLPVLDVSTQMQGV